MRRDYHPVTGRALYVAIGDIMDYGRHCVGIREPDALARFVDVIQIADHEILGR